MKGGKTMKECIPVSQIEVGDTIDTCIGYAYTVTKIEQVIQRNCSPMYEITSYSNIDDDKKETTHRVFAGNYVMRIAKNFEYEPQIKLS